MAQQTAVDWLYEQMSDKQPNWLYVIDTKEYVQKLWEQAKQMEKEQLEDAFKFGVHEGYLTDINYLKCNDDAEQYYNETYNK